MDGRLGEKVDALSSAWMVRKHFFQDRGPGGFNKMGNSRFHLAEFLTEGWA